MISDRYGIRQAIPEDWRERFIEAYDQEFREWIVAAGNGTATGPSTWDGYAATLVADAALRAVESRRPRDDHHAGQARALRNSARRRLRRDRTQVKDDGNVATERN